MKWLIVCLVILGSQAQAACRHALVLALDVSGSVDDDEYRLQRDGVATALLRPKVQDLLLRSSPVPVSLAVFEWSGPTHQSMILNWTVLNTDTALQSAAATIRQAPRIKGDLTTALGSAMQFGANLLAQKPGCWRQTIDISGDGEANTGPRPQDITTLPANITINGLVIGAGDQFRRDERAADIKELSAYFESYVLRGADAFIETALGFDSYADAMERKLLRELASLALGAAPDSQPITAGLQSNIMPRQRPLWIKPRQ